MGAIPNNTNKDKFYIKREEVELYLTKIEKNMNKVAKSIKEVIENPVVSMLCCCCTVCTLDNDHKNLNQNNYLMKKVDKALEELRLILENQKTLIDNNEFIRKEKEFNETQLAYASLNLVEIVVES